MDASSDDAPSRIALQAAGWRGVILASLLQSMRKPTSGEVIGGRAPVAVSETVEAASDEAL